MNLRGHPLHPVLAIFPLSLLTSSVALDIAALVTRDVRFPPAAHFALGAGAIAGVVAAIPGIVDALAYPRAARGMSIRHGVLNGVVLALMVAGWWLRRDAPSAAPSAAALALSCAAAALAALAWRMGIRLTPA